MERMKIQVDEPNSHSWTEADLIYIPYCIDTHLNSTVMKNR